MNEKLQYATMLEMPFSTANVTVMPSKKRKRKAKTLNTETVKEELIQKVNAEQSENFSYKENYAQPSFLDAPSSEQYINDNTADIQSVIEKPSAKRKGGFRVSVIGVQIALIGALIATIFLTNAVNPNSGINSFFKGAFTSSEQTEVVDERLHSDFAPVITYNEGEFVLEDGIMTLSSTGSVYSPCDGVITSLAVDGNGKYTIEIEHSKNFKSRLTGLDYIYGEQGSTVFSNIPVGYMNAEGATLCFMGVDGAVISDYQIVDNSVVWQV